MKFCRERAPLRAGYTGHITQIATRLEIIAESRPHIQKYLDKHAGWQNFAATRLTQAHQASLCAHLNRYLSFLTTYSSGSVSRLH